jgi:hypothetical protein
MDSFKSEEEWGLMNKISREELLQRIQNGEEFALKKRKGFDIYDFQFGDETVCYTLDEETAKIVFELELDAQ